eukprot:GHRR01030334.1.p1 GENE.GHRR01030334.1~~GHRR01030334.1.p1  ORF type:complete len:131 (-),score=29.96 GHRR01030334.1:815-1207(-)
MPMKKLANAPTLQEQRKQWDSMALVYFIKHGPRLLVWLFSKVLALLLFNRIVLWFGGGVPAKQYALIKKDGIPIEQYLARTVDGKYYLICGILPLCTQMRFNWQHSVPTYWQQYGVRWLQVAINGSTSIS